MNTTNSYTKQNILNISILLISGLMASRAEGVNSILCTDTASQIKITKKGKITINSNLVCSSVGTGDNLLISELQFLAHKEKYDEVHVILFAGMDLGGERYILKLDTRQKDNWDTVYYIYRKKDNVLTSLQTNFFVDAIERAKAI